MSALSARRVWRMRTRAARHAASQLPSPTYTSDHRPSKSVGGPPSSGAPAIRARVSGTSGSGRGGVMSVPWLTLRAGRQSVP